MAGTKSLTASVRDGTGKGAARGVRREGRIPGVIYGGGDAAAPISLDYRELNKLIYAGHFLTTIRARCRRQATVIPRDYQLDPIKDQPIC
jgi:large subunit ribosomal protein L25